MQGSLARKLRILRAERGLTQERAAGLIGITPETLSDLERGKRRAYGPTLSKIAKGYGVSVEDLIEEPVPLDSGPSAPVSVGETSIDLQEARRIKKALVASERARETVAYARERFDISDAEAEILFQYVHGFQNPKPQPFGVVESLPEDGSPGVDHEKIRGILQQLIEENRLDPEQVKAVALSLIAS